MNSETLKKIEDYRAELIEKLKEANEERKDLLDKVTKGESLSRKDNKRNQKLAELILELEKKLELFNEIDMYDEIIKGFEELKNSKLSVDEKNNIILSIIEQYKKINKEALKELSNLTGINSKDLIDLNTTKLNLEDELKTLDQDLKTIEKYNGNTKDVQEQIDEKKAIIEHIDNYLNNEYDIVQIETDLNKITNKKTKNADKNDIIEKYKNDIEEQKKLAMEEIIASMEENDLKKRTEEENAKKDGILKQNWKKVVAIASGAILTVTILLIAKNCDKQINQNSTQGTKNPYEIETMYENVDKEKLNQLVNKGYNEYTALLILSNLPNDLIDTLLNVPYISSISEYTQAKDFNLNYITDYEDARIKYNITADKAVDYVNRAYLIQNTEFYQDATINEIVEVVIAIDNKDLYTANNANLAQSFNTTFNDIVNHALFGTTTADDLKKIDALQYFAKDDSDMDLFLTELSTITKKVIANPNDEEAKKEAYNYIATFALSLNGYMNNDEDIALEQPYNTNAQVKDYYNWYIAYNSFVAPLFPVYINDDNYPEFEYLQYIMTSALQGPEFEALCGESLKLGGN